MKKIKTLLFSILLGSFLLMGCTPNDSSSQSQSSETPSSETTGGETGNENPSDLPWIS